MTQLLQNAIYGTAFVIAAAVLRRALKDKLSPGARLALWAACLFRLLTPAAPASVLSLWTLARRLAPEAELAPGPAPAVSYAPAAIPPMAPGYVPGPEEAAAPAAPAVALSPWQVLAGIWLAVGAVLAVRYLLGWRRTRRAVACAIPIGRGDPRYGLLPRFAQLREGPMDGAPLTFGAVRPTVVLSPGLSGQELDCVLAHEGVHARRRDNLWHYVMAAALVVHWWNPAVWLMARMLRQDVELSCDRAAVKKLGEGRRAQYAQTLVSMATMAEGPEFCQTFGRKATEERIRSIMKYKKTTVFGVVLTLALVLCLTAAFASDPVDEESTTSSAPSRPILAVSGTGDEDGKVAKYTVNLDYLEKNLAEHVADGSMTQAEADWIMEKARAFSEDGKALVWSFQGDSGLTMDELHQICYRDADGHLVPADPATVTSTFIFPGSEIASQISADPMVEVTVFGPLKVTVNVPEGMEDHPAVQNAIRLIEENGGIRRNSKGETYGIEMEGQLTGVELDLVAAIGTQGEEGYIREHEGKYGGYPGTVNNPEEAMAYMAWLETQPDTILVPLYDCEGNVIGTFGVGNSSIAVEPASAADGLCSLPTAPTTDCGVEGCTETRLHYHQGERYTLVEPLCTDEGCTVSGEHHHEGDMVVHHDETHDPGTGYPVCTVGGCTTLGIHTHDGTVYACNGAHCGGVCDGSCNPWSASPSASGAGGHHGESHHSESHHSSHH